MAWIEFIEEGEASGNDIDILNINLIISYFNFANKVKNACLGLLLVFTQKKKTFSVDQNCASSTIKVKLRDPLISPIARTYTKMFIRATVPCPSFYPKFKAQNDDKTVICCLIYMHMSSTC